MTKKNKVIIVFVVLSMLISLFTFNVSALSTLTPEEQQAAYDCFIENKVGDSENRNNYIICKFESNGNINYQLFGYSDESECVFYDVSHIRITSAFRIWNLNDGNGWVFDNLNRNYNFECLVTNLMYTNLDLHNSNGDVLFTQTPLNIKFTLAKVANQAGLEKCLTTILGTVPYLLALVIGLVAFWKCWQFLSALLRKA